LLWSSGILPDDRTTGKRPAFPLVSRLYRNGYNALVLVVVLVLMSLLPSLTPFELICPVRQAFKALVLSVFNF
jgi:hypothetical protein